LDVCDCVYFAGVLELVIAAMSCRRGGRRGLDNYGEKQREERRREQRSV
jgi:hypothetical protein